MSEFQQASLMDSWESSAHPSAVAELVSAGVSPLVASFQHLGEGLCVLGLTRALQWHYNSQRELQRVQIYPFSFLSDNFNTEHDPQDLSEEDRLFQKIVPLSASFPIKKQKWQFTYFQIQKVESSLTFKYNSYIFRKIKYVY